MKIHKLERVYSNPSLRTEVPRKVVLAVYPTAETKTTQMRTTAAKTGTQRGHTKSRSEVPAATNSVLEQGRHKIVVRPGVAQVVKRGPRNSAMVRQAYNGGPMVGRRAYQV